MPGALSKSLTLILSGLFVIPYLFEKCKRKIFILKQLTIVACGGFSQLFHNLFVFLEWFFSTNTHSHGAATLFTLKCKNLHNLLPLLLLFLLLHLNFCCRQLRSSFVVFGLVQFALQATPKIQDRPKTPFIPRKSHHTLRLPLCNIFIFSCSACLAVCLSSVACLWMQMFANSSGSGIWPAGVPWRLPPSRAR